MKTYISKQGHLPYFSMNADDRLAFFRELSNQLKPNEIVMIKCNADWVNDSCAFVRITRVVRVHFPFVPNIDDGAGMAYCQLPDGRECRLFSPPTAHGLYLAPEIWDLLEENRTKATRLRDHKELTIELSINVDNITLADAMAAVPKRREMRIEDQKRVEEEQRRRQEEQQRQHQEDWHQWLEQQKAEEEAGERLDDLFRQMDEKSTN